MNRPGRRTVRSLTVAATAAALAVPALPAAADAAKRSDQKTAAPADAKQKRPGGKGTGRRIR